MIVLCSSNIVIQSNINPNMVLKYFHADGSNFVHMIFAYRETHNPDEFTEEMSLQFKIPVKEEL